MTEQQKALEQIFQLTKKTGFRPPSSVIKEIHQITCKALGKENEREKIIAARKRGKR